MGTVPVRQGQGGVRWTEERRTAGEKPGGETVSGGWQAGPSLLGLQVSFETKLLQVPSWKGGGRRSKSLRD